jgi:hypothetical protein
VLHRLPDRFSAAERERARSMVEVDSRIGEALDHGDEGQPGLPAARVA